MRVARWLLLFGGLWCASLAQPADRVPVADQVYLNAKVWTADPGRPAAEAFAVRGDRLLAVGSSAEIRRHVGLGTAVTDLGGRRVVPGFVDAHWHFPATMRNDLLGAGSLAELQSRLAELVRRPDASGWINNGGWAYAEFPDKLPHRRHVDAIVGDTPAWLSGRDGHMGLASTRALALAGIDRDTPDPPGGRIERDADGEPTGELKGRAMAFVVDRIPRLSAEDLRARVRETLRMAASHGITAVHDLAGQSDDVLAAYETVLADDGFLVRLYGATSLDASPSSLARARQLRERFRGPLIRFGAVKGVLDGTIDARTAWMLEPYVGGGNGTLYRLPDETRRAVALYDREGFQIALHAVGDRTIRFALDTFEEAVRANGPRERRHRLEHLDVAHPTELARMKTLGIVASSQPNFAYPDETNLTNYEPLLGPERMARAQAFADIDRAGLVQVFGSDYPVSPMNVLHALHTAVTRTTRDGRPAGGWHPHQRIGIEAALRHYTRDGAYAAFQEEQYGTLAAGRLADFVVLSEDVLVDPAESLLSARVLLTVMGGRVTFRADAGAPTR